jgi:hypothetical protein
VECRRNLELIWLLGGLRPNYHSIADFRRDNAKALKALNREFVQLCRALALIDGERVGVDGSFFKASASAASVKTLTQLKRELAALEREIDAYHAEIEANDATETDSADPVSFDAEQLEALKAQVAETQATIKTLEEHDETQLSHTDPDARRLRKNGKSVVGYNVQISVDDQHKLILDAELTNAGNDQGQLAGAVERCGEALGGSIAQRASAATEAAATASPAVSGASSQVLEAPGADDAPSECRCEAAAAHTPAATPAMAERGASSAPAAPSPAANAQAPIDASAAAERAPADTEAPPSAPVYVADSGYYTDADIAACAAQGVPIYVPIPNKASSAEAHGRFPGSDFRYDAEADAYRCPNDCALSPRGQPTRKNGNLRQAYVSRAKDCDDCPLRAQCLPQKSRTRKLYRSEHADAVERHRQHMATDVAKAEIAHRGALCEHPFGTLKRWMGWDHFLVRGLEKAGGELGLIIHCYNLKRVLNILGVAGFIERCRQLRAAAAAQRAAIKRRVFARHASPAQALWEAICAFADLTPSGTPSPHGVPSAR